MGHCCGAFSPWTLLIWFDSVLLFDASMAVLMPGIPRLKDACSRLCSERLSVVLETCNVADGRWYTGGASWRHLRSCAQMHVLHKPVSSAPTKLDKCTVACM